MQPDNPVTRYLANRSIILSPLPEDIRFHPAMLHPVTKCNHPCMVALFRDRDGKEQAIHRTYLTPDGYKLAGEGINPKLMLGSSKGCTMRLSLFFNTIGLTEGIEDALSVTLMTGLPCWAVGSAVGLVNVELPNAIHEVVIFRDNDHAGINAAERAKHRFEQEGRRTRIIEPQGCKDFNELLMTKHKEKAVL
jgi:putative DNA primase/helicase